MRGRAIWDRGRGFQRATVLAGLVVTLLGCGAEPSQRELKNAKAFESLLTAVSLKNEKELEKDAKVIDERHSTGELSDGKYREIREIIEKARAKDWDGAEKRSYEFRKQFGDLGACTSELIAFLARHTARDIPGASWRRNSVLMRRGQHRTADGRLTRRTFSCHGRTDLYCCSKAPEFRSCPTQAFGV